MPLVLGFAVLLGAALLLTKGIVPNASFADILTGKAGDIYSGDSPTVTATPAGADGATSTTQAGAADVNTATGAAGAPAQVQALLAAAKSIVGAPYSKANHAGAFSQSVATIKKLGTDCSGFVSYVLGQGGILTAPQTTQTLPDQPNILKGAGKYVTIYDRDQGAVNNEHVIIDIAGEWFESGGSAAINGSSNDGVNQIAQPSASYLASFNQLLHPAGL